MKKGLFGFVVVILINGFHAAQAEEVGGENTSASSKWSIGIVQAAVPNTNNYSLLLEKRTADHRSWMFEYQSNQPADFISNIFYGINSSEFLTIAYKSDHFMKGT